MLWSSKILVPANQRPLSLLATHYTLWRPPAHPPAHTATDDDTLTEAVTVVAALPREVSVLVDHVELRSIDQIDLVLRDERVVRWGSADASKEKGDVVLTLLAQQGKTYDVSVPGQPTVS